MSENTSQLPFELDNETIIFSYGSLLDHEKLRELLRHRGQFKILETNDITEAANLSEKNPTDIIILKNVRLENVRVSIVTENLLRRWFKDYGGDLQELADEESSQSLFLYARPANPGEKGRTLNGGLICNLTKEEILVLDKYELEPVLKRELTPELKIQGRTFIPKHIVFYAGTKSIADITFEEKTERSKLLDLNRKPGHLSPQAKWQKNVRGK